MKSDIRCSSISVPVPTVLYVSMVDLLSKSNMECGPALKVKSILQEYLDDAGANLPGQSSSTKKTAIS